MRWSTTARCAASRTRGSRRGRRGTHQSVSATAAPAAPGGAAGAWWRRRSSRGSPVLVGAGGAGWRAGRAVAVGRRGRVPTTLRRDAARGRAAVRGCSRRYASGTRTAARPIAHGRAVGATRALGSARTGQRATAGRSSARPGRLGAVPAGPPHVEARHVPVGSRRGSPASGVCPPRGSGPGRAARGPAAARRPRAPPATTGRRRRRAPSPGPAGLPGPLRASPPEPLGDVAVGHHAARRDQLGDVEDADLRVGYGNKPQMPLTDPIVRCRAAGWNRMSGTGERQGRVSCRSDAEPGVLAVAELIPAGRVDDVRGPSVEWLRDEEPPPGLPETGAGGPRQVGRVMALYGGAVPWWRVVRADGRLLPGSGTARTGPLPGGRHPPAHRRAGGRRPHTAARHAAGPLGRAAERLGRVRTVPPCSLSGRSDGFCGDAWHRRRCATAHGTRCGPGADWRSVGHCRHDDGPAAHHAAGPSPGRRPAARRTSGDRPGTPLAPPMHHDQHLLRTGDPRELLLPRRPRRRSPTGAARRAAAGAYRLVRTPPGPVAPPRPGRSPARGG